MKTKILIALFISAVVGSCIHSKTTIDKYLSSEIGHTSDIKIAVMPISERYLVSDQMEMLDQDTLRSFN